MGWSSENFESLCSKLKPLAAAAAPMSGKVKARVPIKGLLLFSASKVGLDNAGSFARALDGNNGDPPTVPDLRSAGD